MMSSLYPNNSYRYVHDQELKRPSKDKNANHLREILEIMRGKEATIQRSMHMWQEGLSAILLYQVPTVQAADIQ